MNRERLEVLANKLMFTMKDDEYNTLLDEFDIILRQMDLIENIKGIDEVEPLIYPVYDEDVIYREDEVCDELDLEDILSNCNSTLYNQVKLPKVVE